MSLDDEIFDPAASVVAVAHDLPDGITPGLVHVRTPTYRRPEALRRCLLSLVAQTHRHWICDVYDDDPDASARAVVEALGDPRLRYTHNRPQRLASGNIDRCFSAANPHGAEYFCSLEDDNFVFPDFMAHNIAAMAREGVEILLRNQAVEFDSGRPGARVSRGGILDRRLTARVYDPGHLRLAVLADIGISNGGLFWSCRTRSDLEVGVDCSATLQEYLRAFAIAEPIFVAMTPLAVWAENGEATTRDLSGGFRWFRRELGFKASLVALQREAWAQATPEQRARFLRDDAFRYPEAQRARGLVKALLRLDVGRALPRAEIARLALRGLFIRIAGRPAPGLRGYVARRSPEAA